MRRGAAGHRRGDHGELAPQQLEQVRHTVDVRAGSGTWPVCWSSTTPRRRSVQALTDAVLAGAHDDAIEGVEVVVRPALEANADDVLAADGYLLGTTANFGYMSGALKHFFDTIFLEAGGALADDGSARPATAAARSRSGCGCTVATTRPVRCARSCRSCRRCRGRRRPRCWRCSATWARRSSEAAYELGGTLAALPDRTERPTDRRGRLWPVRRGERCVRAHGVRLATLAALAASRWSSARCGGKDGGNVDTDQVDTVEAPAARAPAGSSTPEDVAAAEQRDRGRRLLEAAHRRDVRRRRPARRSSTTPTYDDAGARRLRLPDLLAEVPEVPRRRREHW